MANDNKQLYRVILKLLGLSGLLAVGYFILQSAILPTADELAKEPIITSDTLTIDVSALRQGKMTTVLWNQQNVAILHRSEIMLNALDNKPKHPYLVFINSAGQANCPLIIKRADPRYLEDICSHYLFDAVGKAVSSGANHLTTIDYSLDSKRLLTIGKKQID